MPEQLAAAPIGVGMPPSAGPKRRFTMDELEDFVVRVPDLVQSANTNVADASPQHSAAAKVDASWMISTGFAEACVRHKERILAERGERDEHLR